MNPDEVPVEPQPVLKDGFWFWPSVEAFKVAWVGSTCTLLASHKSDRGQPAHATHAALVEGTWLWRTGTPPGGYPRYRTRPRRERDPDGDLMDIPAQTTLFDSA